MQESKVSQEPYFEKNEEIFNNAYSKLEKFLYKNKTEENIEFNDLKINGKRLFIDGRSSTNGKIDAFWHLASQAKDELKYDMYPCENHETKKYCLQKCIFDTERNFLKDIYRIPCIYRASKIQTFIDVINLYNQNPADPRIKQWTIKENDGKHLKIRFTDDERDIDYIIILKVNYNKTKTDISQYMLITAYPVIMKSYKRRFDREYQEHGKK
ncbi:MAG: hypothetical protein IJE68_02980 [Clostridia bacterium]|nr:hypothetical protein [Clostridia bacterium]